MSVCNVLSECKQPSVVRFRCFSPLPSRYLLLGCENETIWPWRSANGNEKRSETQQHFLNSVTTSMARLQNPSLKICFIVKADRWHQMTGAHKLCMGRPSSIWRLRCWMVCKNRTKTTKKSGEVSLSQIEEKAGGKNPLCQNFFFDVKNRKNNHNLWIVGTKTHTETPFCLDKQVPLM